MIRDPVGQVEAAKPAIREVQMYLLAEPPLRPDAEAISDQQHPDQQLGIDGGTAGVAVEIRQMGTDAAQVDKPVDRSQQVVLRDMILKRELVEKWVNLGRTSLAAPKAASSSVSRYSRTARGGSTALMDDASHSSFGVEFCLFASASIRLASTAMR